jgi:uncharacterized protein (UPF0216 family)
MDKDKAVQGVAIYAEFARNEATTQIIITPDGYDSSGRVVRASIVRRTLTKDAPKKQWKFSTLSTLAEGAFIEESEKDQYVEHRMRYAVTLFDQLTRSSWEMVKRPIMIEVSKKDNDMIYAGKAPSKMLYRIAQSRTALDFPAELVNNITVAV